MGSKETDLQLAQRIVADMGNGDTRSFGILYAKYHPILMKYAESKLTPNIELANDIVSTFWLDVVRKNVLANFSAQQGSSLKTYFHNILRNKISDHFRKKDNQLENFVEFDTVGSTEEKKHDSNYENDTTKGQKTGWDSALIIYECDDNNNGIVIHPGNLADYEITSGRKKMLHDFVASLAEPKRSIMKWHLEEKSGAEICCKLQEQLNIDMQESAVRQHISRIKSNLVIIAQRHRIWEEQTK